MGRRRPPRPLTDTALGALEPAVGRYGSSDGRCLALEGFPTRGLRGHARDPPVGKPEPGALSAAVHDEVAPGVL